MPELEQARKERDEAFTEFIEHTAKADKHSQKAKGARAKYMLANDTV